MVSDDDDKPGENSCSTRATSVESRLGSANPQDPLPREPYIRVVGEDDHVAAVVAYHPRTSLSPLLADLGFKSLKSRSRNGRSQKWLAIDDGKGLRV